MSGVKRRSTIPKKFKSKHARAICKAVAAAGGTVRVTAKGHFLVTGPAGNALVGTAGASYHATANAVASIRKYSGLDITVKV